MLRNTPLGEGGEGVGVGAVGNGDGGGGAGGWGGELTCSRSCSNNSRRGLVASMRGCGPPSCCGLMAFNLRSLIICASIFGLRRARASGPDTPATRAKKRSSGDGEGVDLPEAKRLSPAAESQGRRKAEYAG